MIHLNLTLLTLLLVCVGFALLDWIAGILVAVKAGTFQARAIPRQLGSVVLPYIGGLLVFAAFQTLADGFNSQAVNDLATGAFTAAGTGVLVGLGHDILLKVAALIATPPAAPPAK